MNKKPYRYLALFAPLLILVLSGCDNPAIAGDTISDDVIESLSQATAEAGNTVASASQSPAPAQQIYVAKTVNTVRQSSVVQQTMSGEDPTGAIAFSGTSSFDSDTGLLTATLNLSFIKTFVASNGTTFPAGSVMLLTLAAKPDGSVLAKLSGNIDLNFGSHGYHVSLSQTIAHGVPNNGHYDQTVDTQMTVTDQNGKTKTTSTSEHTTIQIDAA